eukprot:gb/GECG01011157.1/.p1 GENE.gb/GECG01011157.1/~~gb/GECG01011157.1/.p1  ORF type:complete len:1190 (+),score=197.09 gb/GECG01011157.1/:1-3570(+)
MSSKSEKMSSSASSASSKHEEEEDKEEEERINQTVDDSNDDDANVEVEYKLEDEDAKRAKSKRQAQLEKLKDVKDKQMAKVERENELKSQRRLEFLMQQAEVFSHFMSGENTTADADTTSTKKGKKGNKGKSKDVHRAHHRLTEEEEDNALVAAAMDSNSGMRVSSQPTIMEGGNLRDYQIEGLNWLVGLYDTGISGILADEMGLGKTIQTIALLAFLKQYRQINGPHLIIVPKSTMGNWYREFKKWCPSFRVLRLQGQKEERKRLVTQELMSGHYEVVVTTYETVIIEKAAFRKFQWRYIIIDEAHRIKNEKSALSKEVRNLDSQNRLLLTGTPLQNNLHELWALLNFLLPDVFGDADDFDQWFNADDGGMRDTVIQKLHTILKPFLLRRLKSDVEKSLPPKVETKLYVGMTQMQRDWYQKILTKDATSLNQIGGPDKVRLLNILMQLRKVCNHPYLFEGAEPGPPYNNGPHLWENAGKMLLLNKLLPKLKQQGSRILIFSQMTRMLDILEDFLLAQDYEYCRIDGNTQSEDRDQMMEDFNAKNSSKFVFLLSTRAGGLGINLYTADVVILYDSDWNPQMDLQAQDRAHRIGQTKQVRVFRFITESTIEEKIIERAERKLYLDAAIVQQGRLMEQNKQLSKDEMMQMVRFGADEIFRSDRAVVTDEDVDAILARGEEKTQQLNEKIKRDMSHNLSNFSLDSASLADKSVYEIGEFSGTMNRQKQSRKTEDLNFINLPQRQRKQNYDVSAYYREILNTAKGRSSIKESGRVIKIPNFQEHQFFDHDRLRKLYEKQNDLAVKAHTLQQELKEVSKTEAHQRKKGIRSLYNQYASEGYSESEARDKAERDYEKTIEETPRSEQIKAELEKLQLSDEEKEEKEKLLQHGFGSWNKHDFSQFIKACENNGRDNLDDIVEDVSSGTGKTEDEVREYYRAFWKNYKRITGWEKLLNRIRKGEEKIERQRRVEAELAEKISRHPDPYNTLTLPSTGKGISKKGFTEEHDRFLLCMVNELGYGQWDALRVQIRQAYAFRFDWFIKSRTSAELAKRCDQLMRLVERENESMRPKSQNRKKKAKESTSSQKRSRPQNRHPSTASTFSLQRENGSAGKLELESLSEDSSSSKVSFKYYMSIVYHSHHQYFVFHFRSCRSIDPSNWELAVHLLLNTLIFHQTLSLFVIFALLLMLSCQVPG